MTNFHSSNHLKNSNLQMKDKKANVISSKHKKWKIIIDH